MRFLRHESGLIPKNDDQTAIMDIIPVNREHILRYISSLSAKGLTAFRQLGYISKLKKLSRMCPKDFKDYTRQDIEMVMSEMRRGKPNDKSQALFPTFN